METRSARGQGLRREPRRVRDGYGYKNKNKKNLNGNMKNPYDRNVLWLDCINGQVLVVILYYILVRSYH